MDPLAYGAGISLCVDNGYSVGGYCPEAALIVFKGVAYVVLRQVAVLFIVVGAIDVAIGIAFHTTYSRLIVKHPQHSLFATYIPAIGTCVVIMAGKVDEHTCTEIIAAEHVGGGAHPEMPFVIVGKHVTHCSLNGVLLGTELIDVVEMVSVIA